ncbi:uncharacterized protein SOCG_01256 [Schizosaccharomyces octosporus yFS286]|uniref:Signal peptidase complex subunit 1 n=1 Tax=Schizosaccharomyces octosporus (strain yFS286) TaxID=483514 RepID=S9RA81_SCHOY|nr:uncharacterized protein SOCG_01256 [Schizosaccharomyces octosporus yFS286]EPX71034.1 hypothetical protein SOCG_01256 [Schizosaccharomyces octosporus yFS286]
MRIFSLALKSIISEYSEWLPSLYHCLNEKELTSTMNYLEGKIDFHGQILCSKYMNYATVISGVAAYIAGWLAQDSFLSIKVFVVLSIITGIICIPAWPMYNQKPLQFQKTKN